MEYYLPLLNRIGAIRLTLIGGEMEDHKASHTRTEMKYFQLKLPKGQLCNRAVSCMVSKKRVRSVEEASEN